MPCGSAKDNKNGENGQCGFQDLDHSVLQHSLVLGVGNVKQIMLSVKNGTREVKDLLLNECSIIYECKVCANLFRSLANFLYHKRCYCKKHLCEDMPLFNNFEENVSTVVVNPEAPEENHLPQMRECTVELEKADIAKEKGLLATQGSGKEPLPSSTKERPGRKGLRAKEQTEEDAKKNKCSEREAAGKERSSSPVLEEKNKGVEENTKRNRPEKAAAEVKDPPRSESPMISRRTREKNKRVAKAQFAVEPPKKIAKTTKNENAKGCADNGKSKADSAKGSPDSAKGSLHNGKANVGGKSKDDSKKDSGGGKSNPSKRITLSRKDLSLTDASSTESLLIDDTMHIENSTDVTDKQFKKMTDDTPKIIDIVLKSTSQMTVKEEKDKNETQASAIKVCSPSKMLLKPVKKIILANPKSLDLKNGSVFNSIQSKIKGNKIGFTKIANTAGKNLQCFPKIIFKTLDGNPHAVFQATDGGKSENASEKSKPEVATASSQPSMKNDEKKVCLKDKDANTTPEEVSQPISSTPLAKASRQHEYHITRRKRLLARSDCNVAELKCLSCRTCFTSIKTLYFHMLSIHSKKRLYYPCPFCKQFFVQMYGVTRHLISIHNKSKEQINKLRDVIKKKSIWKKVDDSSLPPREDDKPRPRSTPFKEIKIEDEAEEVDVCGIVEPIMSSPEANIPKTPPKSGKNSALHQCSKCNRTFERKSSQVSHEKFCIMNAIKVEMVDLTIPMSPPPNVSFLSLSPKAANVEPPFQMTIKSEPMDPKSNTRPKRGAEKQMHKDFVNSQTLKWRSANRVDTKAMPGVRKGPLKNLEKKVLNIMNVENLLCTKCDKTFSSYSNLRRHVAIHVGWTRFKCKFCEYQAYNKSQCWAHLQKAHAVPDAELDKSVENLSGTPGKRGLPSILNPKQLIEVRPKQMTVKANSVQKVKLGKKKGLKKLLHKKGIAETLKKDKSQPENKKATLDATKDKIVEKSKSIIEVKKDKSQLNDGKKKEKSPNLELRRDSTEARKEKNVESRKESPREKITDCQAEKIPLTPMLQYVSDVRKEGPNYKPVTTNNPTTIILSKKVPLSPTATVQSIVTLSPESLSSNSSVRNIFPLRSSPRKVESKSPEEKSLTSLVTRSGTYTKSGLPPSRSNSIEDVKKQVPQFPEKTYAKKDRLVGEWFPKKDLNSNSSRRESAPLIIGLVPASSDGLSMRAKNPAISYEKSNC